MSIVIDLTDEQIEALAPLFEKVREASKSKKPGMALAQIYPEQIVCGFIPHEGAKKILVALGQEERISTTVLDRKAYFPGAL